MNPVEWECAHHQFSVVVENVASMRLYRYIVLNVPLLDFIPFVALLEHDNSRIANDYKGKEGESEEHQNVITVNYVFAELEHSLSYFLTLYIGFVATLRSLFDSFSIFSISV